MTAAGTKAWTSIAIAAVAALALAGCGDRPGSEKAGVALAEAVYPGAFVLHDSYLQKGHYDVALVKRGDSLTRLRFAIDADPAQCRVGTACEQRLHRAYAEAVATGIKLKALNAGFAACDIPMLGLDDAESGSRFRVIVELGLDPADQQPALDRLVPCITTYRQALPAKADEHLQVLSLRILRPAQGGPTAPQSMTLDSRLPGARAAEPSYQVTIAAGDDRPRAADLRLYVHYVRESGLGDKLADVARDALAKDSIGGHVPNYALNWQLKLDPQRLDVVRTYVLACSVDRPGTGPCRTDIAVRMRYDLIKDEASEVGVIHNVRDDRGSSTLAKLPGR
ncbi:hypothetical protein M2333_002289 [Sphingobium sp. B11D3B]|uniref:hypothetical protein n=1 Tax=unclassified Sphingobium TaxID=2611147 RepID=UPI0022252E93|nr:MULTISPECIES: hypothetical protein [unclassified Sphingobium]MCW2365123.1 hypothetical protein [Sphingobium sp. B7D2B]MCW2389243.1 hypothetical protein [Sphingobium sp. B11D3B]